LGNNCYYNDNIYTLIYLLHFNYYRIFNS